jgi:hypothetical protein
VLRSCGESGTGQPCRITVDHASFFGNRVLFDGQGDVTIICSTFQTIGPRDLHHFTSAQGSVLAGSLAIPNPDPRCVCPAACASRFRGGIESNMEITADDNVDLDGACVEIAEDITIVANGTNPPLLAGGVMIDLSHAEIRDDFGKTGIISVTAHPIAPINVIDGGVQNGDGALIIDTGKKGGGPDPKAVATMNGGDQILLNQPCGAIDPDSSCVGRGIDLGLNPSRADPASRTLRNVINSVAVRCDT